jgi:hypothetical protein
LEKIEKSLIDMTALHVELEKSDVHNPLKAERVAAVKRDLELAYLQRTSGAYQGEHGEQLHTLQKRECGIGWKDRLDGGAAA